MPKSSIGISKLNFQLTGEKNTLSCLAKFDSFQIREFEFTATDDSGNFVLWHVQKCCTQSDTQFATVVMSQLHGLMKLAAVSLRRCPACSV